MPRIELRELDWGARENRKKRIDDGPAEVRTCVSCQLDVRTSFSTMTTDQLEILANS